MPRTCAIPGCSRPALFRYRGAIKADHDHDICQQHFRSISESNRQKEMRMTARLVDAQNQKLSDGMFAAAYRMTIPLLADAKHVTVRACSARLSELSADATDISDVVEIGTAKDGKSRVVAVPVSVHVDDGAAVIQDDSFDKHTVSFEVNGIPEVQIVNLKLSMTEQAAEDKQKAAEAAKAKQADNSALDKDIEAAREAGRKKALLAKAEAEGAASVEAPKGNKPS